MAKKEVKAKKEKELTPKQLRKLEEQKEREKYEEIIDKLYDERDEVKANIKKNKGNKEKIAELKNKIKDIDEEIRQNKELRSQIGASNTFIGSVFAEMKLVRWPKFKEVVKYSIAVLVFVLFFSGFFYLINILFGLFVTLVRGA